MIPEPVSVDCDLRCTGCGHDVVVVADTSGTLSLPGRKFKPEDGAKEPLRPPVTCSGRLSSRLQEHEDAQASLPGLAASAGECGPQLLQPSRARGRSRRIRAAERLRPS